MPYPQDPFALRIKSSYACPTCKITMIRETKDQQSPFLGQMRCEKCGFISDVDSMRAAATLPAKSVRGR